MRNIMHPSALGPVLLVHKQLAERACHVRVAVEHAVQVRATGIDVLLLLPNAKTVVGFILHLVAMQRFQLKTYGHSVRQVKAGDYMAVYVIPPLHWRAPLTRFIRKDIIPPDAHIPILMALPGKDA